MQRLFFFLLCITSHGMYAQESSKEPITVVSQHVVESDSVDALLDDVRQNPEDQAPVIRPVSCVEFWFKRIGTCILINCIAFKNYIARYVLEHGHEKKDSN